jgi:hypothetical protein
MIITAPEKIVEPYWFQEVTLDTDARFIAMMGGTGGGKTWWGPVWLYQLIAKDVEAGHGEGARYLVIGRTYRMTMDILVPELKKCFEGTRLEGSWHASLASYTLPTGGTIYFRSADEPYRIEGFHTRGIWVDEPSEMPALIWIVIQARVGLYQAPVLFTGYPTNMGWYHNSIYQPWKDGDPDYCCIQFDSTENPIYAQKEMDRAKATLPAWMYDMRNRGLFRKPFGLVYPDFGAHLFIDPFGIPSDWPTYVGVDPGVHYGALMWAWHDGTFYSYNEFYVEEVKGADEYASAMLGKIEGIDQGWIYDPARLTDVVNLVTYGCGPFYKANHAVDAGIVTLTGLLKQGRLKVMKGRCPNFIDEMEKYSYPTDAASGKINKDKPIKKDDHLPDCARYLAHTLISAPLEERGTLVVDLGEEISAY